MTYNQSVPGPTPAGVAEALYAAERQAGASTQASMLVLWGAATTYFTAAFGVYALLESKDLNLSQNLRLFITLLLPLPACAIAAYHLIFFGIGVKHSKSIQILEKELVGYASNPTRRKWNAYQVGSRSEISWTDFNLASTTMKIASVISFSAPYLGAVALIAISLSASWSLSRGWTLIAWWALTILYCAISMTVARLGHKTLTQL